MELLVNTLYIILGFFVGMTVSMEIWSIWKKPKNTEIQILFLTISLVLMSILVIITLKS